MEKTLTIYDLAKALGVSGATISMALRKDPRVSEKTRKRVCEYAEQVGFNFNLHARNFRLKRNGTIALVVANIANDFWHEAIVAAGELLPEGTRMVVFNYNTGIGKERDILHTLAIQKVDGVIFQPQDCNAAHISEFVKSGIPLVLLERTDLPGIPFVKTNDRHMAEEVVKYCHAHGHTAMGCLSLQSNILGIRDRVDGFLDAANQLGIAENCEVMVAADFSEAATRAALTGDLRRFSVILCLDDRLAAWAERDLQRQKIQIPQEVSLIGWNNSLFLNYLAPSLSSVALPMHAIISEALQLLESTRQGNVHADGKLLAGSLVIRESFQPYPSKEYTEKC